MSHILSGMRITRFGVMVMAGLLVGIVGVAAPASAQPGSHGRGGEHTNRYEAQRCQHSGYQVRVEAETGRAFRNSGDCSSHTAKGGTTGFPVTINPIGPYTCGNSQCWGTLTVTGLAAGTVISVISIDSGLVVSPPVTVKAGADTYQLNIDCGYPSMSQFQAVLGEDPDGTPVSDIFIGNPC